MDYKDLTPEQLDFVIAQMEEYQQADSLTYVEYELKYKETDRLGDKLTLEEKRAAAKYVEKLIEMQQVPE